MLRLGIVLVGLKLSLADVARVGLIGVPVILGLVALAIPLGLALARALGLHHRLGLLAAASTGICGVTATLAVAPAVQAEEPEVAATVANVTLFGLLAMLVHPWLAHALYADSPAAAGLFLGTAIHDTSQVMGAAIAYEQLFGEPRAMQVATVAKLTRNAALVLVVPAITALHARLGGREGRRPGLGQLLPGFVLGFLAMAALRSLGEHGLDGGGRALGLLPAEVWTEGLRLFGERLSGLCLATALAGVGLSTRLSTLRALGPRPLLLGMLGALGLSLLALLLAGLVGPRLG